MSIDTEMLCLDVKPNLSYTSIIGEPTGVTLRDRVSSFRNEKS
jgi:hypothetical protein